MAQNDVDLGELANQEVQDAPPPGHNQIQYPLLINLPSDTREFCFAEYFGSDVLYPPENCESPQANLIPSCLTVAYPFPQADAVFHSDPDPTTGEDVPIAWHPCRPVPFDPPIPVREQVAQAMEELCDHAMKLLHDNRDIARWACCLMTYWAPQWSTALPDSYYNIPPGGVKPQMPVAPAEWQWWVQTGQFRGPSDFVEQVDRVLERGHVDIVLVSRFQDPTRRWPDGRVVQGLCVEGSPSAGAIDREDVANLQANNIRVPYEFAVTLAVGHRTWEVLRDAHAPGQSPENRSCAAVRAAAIILHEIVHVFGQPWTDHLRNRCLDPCNMVASAFERGMSIRMPCINASTCCAYPLQDQHFLRYTIPPDPLNRRADPNYPRC